MIETRHLKSCEVPEDRHEVHEVLLRCYQPSQPPQAPVPLHQGPGGARLGWPRHPRAKARMLPSPPIPKARILPKGLGPGPQ